MIEDTSISAQRKRLRLRLEQGPIDTLAIRKELNILAPAARIKELKERGDSIITIRVALYDDYGRKHSGIARYCLVQHTEQGHEG